MYLIFGMQRLTTYIALIQKCDINSTDIFFRETNLSMNYISGPNQAMLNQRFQHGQSEEIKA